MGKLDELNAADDALAVSLVSPLIEKAPQLAKKVANRRPFENAEQLSLAIRQKMLGLSEVERIALFRSHPELAPATPLEMTRESQREQGRLNLTLKENGYRTFLIELNARYRAKFGFPFITALVRHKSIDSILNEFEERLSSDRQSEIERAIYQIATVSASRVQAAFGCDKADDSARHLQGQVSSER